MTFIYGLNDPKTGECRYLGKTKNLHKRYKSHLFKAKQVRTHKNCWIYGLLSLGSVPTMEVIDEVPDSEWEFWEKEYIRVFKAIGVRLTNMTDGGGNAAPSPEQKIKLGLAMRGRKISLETRQRISIAKLGIRRSSPMSFEARQRIRIAKLGKKLSPEICKRREESKKGKI